MAPTILRIGGTIERLVRYTTVTATPMPIPINTQSSVVRKLVSAMVAAPFGSDVHAPLTVADATTMMQKTAVIAALLAVAAARGAAYNVRVNVQALEDKSKGQSLAREAEQLVKKASDLGDQVTRLVERALSS